MNRIKILNSMHFCFDRANSILGLAGGSTFASQAWIESDELYDQCMGNKFDWLAPDGEYYIDHKDNFTRPTEEEIRQFMTPKIESLAIKRQVIEVETTFPHDLITTNGE